MDQSRYLIQALGQMSQQPAPPVQQGPDLTALAAGAKQRREWERSNPGQNYMQHGVQQDGVQQGLANLQGVPDRLGQVPGQLAGIPGQLAGLLSFGGKR